MRAHVLNQDGDIINTILVDEIGLEQIDADIYGGGIGQWWNGSAVVIKPRDVEKETAEQAASVRASRTEKLKDCDWTQLVDSTADKAAWATYRQALRDIPTQNGFPWIVTYPDKP
jgi:hypothetical protein